MRFRPCIDIHNGKVKQIVGGSLRDEQDYALENFVSEKDAAWYARKYRQDGLSGGHVILLNPVSSAQYEATRAQAVLALGASGGTLQAGGGITPENAGDFLDAGASHVIVTSYVFRDGKMDEKALLKMVSATGRDRLVLDLSVRKCSAGSFRITTDRWQNMTSMDLSPQLLKQLESSCDEFLIHAVDVEGKAKGPQTEVLRILGRYTRDGRNRVTYAGGIASMYDVDLVERQGEGRVDFTVGSALDLFGGILPYKDLTELSAH